MPRPTSIRRRRSSARALARACATTVATGVAAAPAVAGISPVTLVEGPSSAIVELGGVAMAPDGTGGLVYRRREADGRNHIYAARFDGVAWRPPSRVDVGQRFDSSWPTIAAADGGRLVVVWVHEFGVGSDRLFGASLDPGATRFQPPVPVDLNVGESTSTWPSVAMNRSGVAYVAYRVVFSTSQENASLPGDTVEADVRVARSAGQFWSVIGQPVDRNAAAPVRTPSALNRPRIGVDVTGAAVVAFHEPDDAQVDRVYARRVFGQSFGVPLQVSPSTRPDGSVERGGVDTFSLDVAGFGAAAVAYRQLGAAQGAFTDARVMTNAIPESFSPTANAFAGARLADGGPATGRLDAPPGTPTVTTTPDGRLLTAFSVGASSVVVAGDDRQVGVAARLDDATSTVPGDPVVEQGPDGATTFAWKSLQGRRGGVVVRELRADGVPTTRALSAPRGGAVTQLVSAGSGLGDAALAWLQGDGDGTQIAAAVVDAPPAQFASQTPVGWVRGDEARVGWDRAPAAIGRVSYTVTLDDDEILADTRAVRADIDLEDVSDGRRTLVVIARDAGGQETESIPSELKVDRTAPTVRVRIARRVASVTLSDPLSLPSAARTRVTWGDGRRTTGRVTRLRHRYRRPGRYRIVIRTGDRAGNVRTVRRTVTVR